MSLNLSFSVDFPPQWTASTQNNQLVPMATVFFFGFLESVFGNSVIGSIARCNGIVVGRVMRYFIVFSKQ